MTLRFLLDTNVAIGLVNGAGVAAALIAQRNATLALCAISQISRMEMLSFHALSPDELANTQLLLSAVTTILLDELIETEAIAFRRRTRLKLPDAVVGATAVVHSLELLTFDAKLRAALAAH